MAEEVNADAAGVACYPSHREVQHFEGGAAHEPVGTGERLQPIEMIVAVAEKQPHGL